MTDSSLKLHTNIHPSSNQPIAHPQNSLSFREKNINDTLRYLNSILERSHITRVSNITGLDDIGIPVWQAIRPLSNYLCVAQGKGASAAQAQVSAIMESLELYHLESIDILSHISSYNNRSKANDYLDPKTIHHGCFIHPDIHSQTLEWVKSVNLSDMSRIWVPKEALSLDMRTNKQHAHYFRQTSTGIAGGNSILEASCKALLEVIERYTLQYWKKENPTCIQHVALPITNPSINQLVKKITMNQKQIRLHLINNQWSIPVYFCEIIDQNTHRNLGTCVGTGCHLDHSHAIEAAILEAVQTRLTIVAGSRDDNYATQYNNRHINQPLPITQGQFIQLTEKQLTNKYIKSENIRKELMRRFHNSGTTDILMVNHTKKHLKVPMTQILIPSLGAI